MMSINQHHLSTDEMLSAAANLPPVELKQFIARLLVLEACRQAPVLSAKESELLLKINRALPEALQQRYQYLTAKRDAETLTAAEHTELLNLTETNEQFMLERMQALALLAQLRGQTLAEVMHNLGIQWPHYD